MKPPMGGFFHGRETDKCAVVFHSHPKVLIFVPLCSPPDIGAEFWLFFLLFAIFLSLKIVEDGKLAEKI